MARKILLLQTHLAGSEKNWDFLARASSAKKNWFRLRDKYEAKNFPEQYISRRIGAHIFFSVFVDATFYAYLISGHLLTLAFLCMT